MPAICPLERPWWLLEGLLVAPAAVFVADGVEFEVEEGKNGGMGNTAGNVTPVHRLSTFEPIQQESVALGELVAQ